MTLELSRWWFQRFLAFAAPVAVVIVVYLAGRACLSEVIPDNNDFEPLQMRRFEIKSTSLVSGQTLTLLDGVCNTTNEPVQAMVYLGAQSEGGTFNTATVDLLTKPASTGGQRIPVTDTPEGRLSQVFEPGCTATEPITAVVPTVLTPGLTWRLKVHIVVNGPQGETQNLTKVSNKFTVNEP